MDKYICKNTGGTLVCFKRAVALSSKHCYIVEKASERVGERGGGLLLRHMLSKKVHFPPSSAVWFLLLCCPVLCLASAPPVKPVCPLGGPPLGLALPQGDAGACWDLLHPSTGSGGYETC